MRRRGRSWRNRLPTTVPWKAFRFHFAGRGRSARRVWRAAPRKSRSTLPSIPRCSDAPRPEVRLMLSCGEASGDWYAGALTRALGALNPGVTIAGLGGPQFAAAGGRLIDDCRDLAVTGLTEPIVKIPRLLKA